MFNKLRRRMLWFNMLTISSVMIVAFVTIFVVTYFPIQKEIEKKLEHARNLHVQYSEYWQYWQNYLSGQIPLWDINQYWKERNNKTGYDQTPKDILYNPDLTSSIRLIVNAEGELFDKEGNRIYPSGITSLINLKDETSKELAALAWAQKKGTVTLEGRKWQFCVFPGETESISITQGQSEGQPKFRNYEIIFVDIEGSYAALVQLSVILVIVGVFMLAILFFISSIFARRSIGPLEENWNKQKRFVTDASHELKTPIAIITSNMDAIEASGEETVESQKEWFGYIRSELKRLSTLISDLLYLAKSEDIMQQEKNLLPFDFSAAIETDVTAMEAMIHEKGITLTSHVEENILVAGDEVNMKQAALILLDNASKYTPEKGEITVTLTQDKGDAIFCVKNSGDGISQKDLPRIFDRFYRPDSSRSKETGGYGLGLSIAKAIVERAGGTISAQSHEGVTTFTMTLKLYK